LNILAGDSRSLLPPVFQQQRQLTCQVLELAVRARALVSVPAVRRAVFADDILKAVLGLCGEYLDAATAAAAKQHAQQLFALAMSCLKLAAA
jgi:hypothetical protein